MFKIFSKLKKNRGMTYVELIVVLSIFAVMSSIVVFNYGDFQARIDIKNLANDIALKVVGAQKAAVFGQSTTHATIVDWKPSYGVYFTTHTNGAADNKSFNYFADINNNADYDDTTCSPSTLTSECLEKLDITKGNYISDITVYYQDGTNRPLNDVTMIFKRPALGASFNSGGIGTGVTSVKISISSPRGLTSSVRVYASGRIQIN